MRWFQISFPKHQRIRLKNKKYGTINVLSALDREILRNKKRVNGADTYSRLHLRSVGVASKAWKFSACCRCRTVELRSFRDATKRRWIRCGENFPRIGVVVRAWSMIAPFSVDAIAILGSFYQPSFLSDVTFSKSLVLHEIRHNTWSEMFPPARDQSVCVNAIALSRK